MPVAYQGVNRFSNAVALLVSGRVLVLRQIADALIETGFVTGSRLVESDLVTWPRFCRIRAIRKPVCNSSDSC